MNSHAYTIAEVAKALGVSPSTVSRAINNGPGVGAELRKKILDYVEEIGYRPNAIAQGLSRGHSNMVSLIIGDMRNPFYADLAFGIQQNLAEHGYVVTTFNSEYDVKKELQIISFAKQYHYCGVILVTVNNENADDYLKQIDLPFLLVNRVTDHYNGSFVVTDNFQAGYIAARHLINLGHRRIGFLSGHHKSSTASYHRFLGFQQALKNYCIPYKEEFCLFDLNWRLESGYEAAKRIFAKRTQLSEFPSAFILSNDLSALGFMNYCEENAIRIPEDISIVSFDNIIYSSLHRIQLTTVSQHASRLSEEASKVMVELLENPPAEPRRVIIEPTLIERNSTKSYSE